VHTLKIVFGITLYTIFFFVSISSATTTIRVPEDNITIQEAINSAAYGDIIEVHSGTYFERVDVNKLLTIKGIDNGGGIPVVDAQMVGSPITLSIGSEGSAIEGFKLINSQISYNNAGIIAFSSNNIIKNNVILGYDEGADYYGKGIMLYQSSNNIISRNFANSSSIGIHVYESNNNTLDYNVVTANHDGITVYNSSNNTIRGNFANSSIIGIYILGLSNNNTLNSNNVTGNIQGIIVTSSSNNTFSDNSVISNNNRGIWISQYSSDNNLIGNHFDSNGELGINLDEHSDRNNVIGNTINSNYWGILLNSESNVLRNNIVNDNPASGIEVYTSGNNILNNIFNNSNNFNIYFGNRWNSTKTLGINVISGHYLGGNFWAQPDGNGYSQDCLDSELNGICDLPYKLNDNNFDYLPLSIPDNEPPNSVTYLTNITFAYSFINWTWIDPEDHDFVNVSVWIDGTFKENVSNGVQFYNSTSFAPDTEHTISTRTVDINGNINQTWKNHTATTAPWPISDIVNLTFIVLDNKTNLPIVNADVKMDKMNVIGETIVDIKLNPRK
jgi:parallel beta-helix repeat protein